MRLLTVASTLLAIVLSVLMSGAGAAGHASGRSPTAGCSAPLPLLLQPGIHVPPPHGWLAPARDIPPGPVMMQVPLYPGAVVSTLPMPLAPYPFPVSTYVKSAWGEFILPVGQSAAMDWYQRALAQCGFRNIGADSSYKGSQTVSIGSTLADRAYPPDDLSLAVNQGPGGTTLVRYVAYTITLPPPAILVPGTPNAVTILSYVPLVPRHPAAATPSTRTIVRDPAAIRALQHHLNNLPHGQGPMSCPYDDGSHDDLRFTYPDGHKLTVRVKLWGCEGVQAGHKTAMALSDQGLFALLGTFLRAHGQRLVDYRRQRAGA